MKKEDKRKVELVVLSDIHLGTFGCRAKEVLNYLKSIEPETLVLNGDIIDVWQFNKHYFPKSHMKVIKHITSLLSKGKKVYYITGNHDEMLRKFKGFQLGNFEIVNKLVLNLGEKKAWFFHGDVFDVTMKNSKWLAKLGGLGYDLLIVINTIVNLFSRLLKQGRISFSKKIKDGVKGALKHINNFEETVAGIAISNGYDFVVCGHIHQPQMKNISNKQGQQVLYLNSGDWIENLTALEYHNNEWLVYEYANDQVAQNIIDEISPEIDNTKFEHKRKQLFDDLLEELQFLPMNTTSI
jgi:UDP-2,3-diacylglucosamine pyrophosphatase LpxH